MSARHTERGSRGMTREELIGLGRCGRAREFIAIATRALEQAPGDAGVRFLLAANLGQIGLRTLATETLDALPEGVQQAPDVRSLRDALARLPDDRVGERERASIALGNLRALRVRGLDLSGAIGPWRERLALNDCYRCADGNLVRRMRWAGAPHWAHFVSDQLGVAARFVEKNLAPADAFPRPLAIEGLDPPWLFARAWERLARNRVGYAAPITILQADPLELLDGLSAMDLRERLVDPRVRVFVGPDASQRWLNDALERVDEVVIGMVAPLAVTRARVSPGVEAAVGRVSAAQTEEFRRAQARTDAVYKARDARFWAARYAEARVGGRALRVLLPTSRYSTYVRHAAEDLAEAFRGLGCEALVFMEASADSRPSGAGYARLVERFEPDLVALINYCRGDAGLPFPASVPWLCWVQDAMPHQFNPRVWGELDFAAGHVHKEMRAQPGFAPERALAFPVAASARKFHPAPVPVALRERFACEVAYVSHQSETPEAFHRRIIREEGAGASAAMLAQLRPQVERVTLELADRSLVSALELLTKDAVGAGDERRATYIFRHYALPLADRVLRHQMLGWAADICERRRWRLRLYGRGWEQHPTLGRYACAGLAHGEELRACYQSAAAHLHGSVSTMVHQRVMECALSGGLPLGRLTYDAISESTGWAQREAVLRGVPAGRNEETGAVAYVTADTPALAELAAQRRRLGLEYPELVWVSRRRAESYLRPDHPAATGLHPIWLYGDLAETTFRSAEELERRLEVAVERPDRRVAASGAMASRVRERCTVDAFARRVLDLIGASLASAAGASAAGESGAGESGAIAA